MKALITTDAVGEVWNYTANLAHGLARQDVTLVIVCMGPEPNAHQLRMVQNKPGISFYHRPFRLEWMNDPWEDIEKAGAWLLKIARAENPDLIHLNAYTHAVLDWNRPVIVVGHSCVYTWFEAVKGCRPPEDWSTYYQHVRRGLQSADVVVAPSIAMLRAYERIYGEFKSTRVICNGIAQREEPVTVEEPFVFGMGRLWDEAKNVQALVEASRHIGSPVVIAGAGNKQNIEVPTNLFFLGQLDHRETFRWLRKSGIYVLPVKYEPFDLTFLEAAVSGCALVGGDIPTLREIWGDAMCYVHPDDPEALASTCNRLITNPEMRAEMAHRAMKRAARYSLSEKISNYLSLYDDVLIEKSRIV